MTSPAPTDPDALGLATPAAVQAWLGPLEESAATLAQVCDAVNALIVGWRGDPPAGGYPASVTRGLVMLAGRLIRRRNSPAGVEAAGDLGPVYVQRNDPDVAMLLGLGTYTPPRIG
ncbi:hypothetical protein [Dietzia sp. 179-F 9C3 NHS]|uniref:hypothetical protein n=1 Tax=Dietzia sp. 179-F 9C3 NHS TaxID=3374295 RepID=UPI00387A33A9